MSEPIKICIQRAATRKEWDEMQADYIRRALLSADRIEKLETALMHIYAWYPISTFNPHQTIKEIKEFARKALEGKDD
jgi:hypothetical protein